MVFVLIVTIYRPCDENTRFPVIFCTLSQRSATLYWQMQFFAFERMKLPDLPSPRL